ncbi:HEPN domain-containing protein [Acinetobacter guillouiae]|uniref:HEPN domain-containing protein n=1 Tax=Acinetobacter guillouiae TaxID=106649 RepID=UPI0028D7F2FF|nr:HEPN domain-containing protein [Acinetobacter guillouiae]
MDFNKLKIDSSRAICEYFDFFKNNTLDFQTAVSLGGFATLSDISYGFSKEVSLDWTLFLTSILKKTNLIYLIALETIDKKMKEIFKEYLKSKNLDIFTEFKKVISELKIYSNQTNFFYFVVQGLHCDEIYSFGNLTIGNFNQKGLKLSFSKKINKNIKLVENERKKNGTFNPEDIFLVELKKTIKKYKDKLVIEISNPGDPLIAKEKSKKDAEEFINQIIFIAHISMPYKFHIQLTADNSKQSIEPLCLNYEAMSTSALNNEIFYKINFNLSENNTDNPSNIGSKFRDLCFPILTTEFKNELLDKLRTSINWYSASIKSESMNESFLFCAIGMEALLTTGRDSITKVLSENTAFLIGKKDIESRKQIYSTMCNLYAHRSGIAHGGNINIETKDLKQIRYYLAMCIIKIIIKIKNNEINSNQDLITFFENQKFG